MRKLSRSSDRRIFENGAEIVRNSASFLIPNSRLRTIRTTSIIQSDLALPPGLLTPLRFLYIFGNSVEDDTYFFSSLLTSKYHPVDDIRFVLRSSPRPGCCNEPSCFTYSHDRGWVKKKHPPLHLHLLFRHFFIFAPPTKIMLFFRARSRSP